MIVSQLGYGSQNTCFVFSSDGNTNFSGHWKNETWTLSKCLQGEGGGGGDSHIKESGVIFV